MEVRPIKTDADYRSALAEIERCWDAASGSPEEDRLDVLVTLVEAYEERHHPILPPDPIEALQYYMESRNLSRHDLETSIGSRGRVAEVLGKRRRLTLEMIRRLHGTLGIPADVLILPYPLSTPSSRPRRSAKSPL